MKRYLFKGAIFGLVANIIVFSIYMYIEMKHANACLNSANNHLAYCSKNYQSFVSSFIEHFTNFAAHQFPYNFTAFAFSSLLAMVILAVLPGILIGAFVSLIYKKYHRK